MFATLQDVDEKILYDTFSAFGGIASNPKVESFITVIMSYICNHMRIDSYYAYE